VTFAGHGTDSRLDHSVSEKTYDAPERTAYNGQFGCTCYYPLFCFNRFGDLERALLHEGQVHTADDWQTVLEIVGEIRRDKG